MKPAKLFLGYCALSVFLFVLCCRFVGNYYEVYEFFFPAVFSGELTDGMPANIFYPIAHIGLGNLYTLLYAIWPTISWYDGVMALFVVLSNAVLYCCIHLGAKSNGNIVVVLLLNVLVTVFLMADTVLHWNYTRVSFSVCIAAATLFLLVVEQKIESRALRSLLTVICALIFLAGVLIRPEVGVLMFMLVMLFLLCGQGISSVFFRQLVPFLVPVVFVAGGIAIERSCSHDFFKQLSPAAEYQIALGKVVDIGTMQSRVDSMKYIALRAGIVNDPANINEQFVDKILGNKSWLQFSWPLWQRALGVLHDNLLANLWPALLFASIFLTGSLFLIYTHNGVLSYLTFNLLFVFLIFSIAYFMTLESRLTAPLLFFGIVTNLMFLIKHNLIPYVMKNRGGAFFFMATAITLLSFQSIRLIENAEQYQSRLTHSKIQYKKLEAIARHKMIVPDASGFMILFSAYKPFQQPDFSAFKKILLNDIETLSLTPDYTQYLNANCNCNSHRMGDFFDYLYSNKNEVLFIAEPERMKLFESYLNIVHQKSYSLGTHVVQDSFTTPYADSVRLFTFD